MANRRVGRFCGRVSSPGNQEAVALLQVGKVVKVEGKPGVDGKPGEQTEQTVLTITPADIVRILEVSQKIQSEILGNAAEDRVADIDVHFTNYEDDPDLPQMPTDDDEEEPLE